MVTGDQIRMARAALQWSVRDLAGKANVTPNTVSRIENGSDALGATLQAIRAALEAGGVEFIPAGAYSGAGGAGVRLRATP